MKPRSILIEIGGGFRYSAQGAGLSCREIEGPALDVALAVGAAVHGLSHWMSVISGRCLTVSTPFCLTVSTVSGLDHDLAQGWLTLWLRGVSSSVSSQEGGQTTEITQFPGLFGRSCQIQCPPGFSRLTYSLLSGSRRPAHPTSPLECSWSAIHLTASYFAIKALDDFRFSTGESQRDNTCGFLLGPPQLGERAPDGDDG